VRLLLPPSETKRIGTAASPLQPASLVAPELAVDRERVVDALVSYCAQPTAEVRADIGTSIRQDAELLRNTGLREAPTAPAHDIYDGVLFDAIDLSTCSPLVLRRVVERVLVQSALFGVVGFGDAIPAYRCSAGSRLPRIGRIDAFWRARLDAAMRSLLADHLVLDLRSGAYASMWTPDVDVAERTTTLRIMQMRGGRRTAVSHMNKATKGRLVRTLCEQALEPTSIHAVAQVIAAAGYEVELLQGGTVLEVLAGGGVDQEGCTNRIAGVGTSNQ
jgi:hypothetical protein